MNKWLIIGIVAFVVIGIVITAVVISNGKKAQAQANALAMAGSGYHVPTKQDNITAMIVALSGVAVAGAGAYEAGKNNKTTVTTA